MDEIRKIRTQIDIIDVKIMDLLDERFKLSLQIGEVKLKQNSSILDENRELHILNNTSKYSHSPQLISVYKTIMNESKMIQNRK